jgi:diguanylate cyclase
MTMPMRRAKFAGAPAVAAGLGFLLGAACHRRKLRQVRAELAAARWLAEHDALTGLPNRAGLQRHHQRLIAAGAAPTVVLLDLDDFKSVNDTWGHQAGDALLAAVADRLANGCGPLDAIAGRLAGDEFLLLLPHATARAALEAVQVLLCELGKPMTLPVGRDGAVTVRPTASAGIALAELSGEQANAWSELLRRADVALYRAKLQRGHAVLHTTGMRQPARDTDVGERMRAQSRRCAREGRGPAGSAGTQARGTARSVSGSSRNGASPTARDAALDTDVVPGRLVDCTGHGWIFGGSAELACQFR